MHFAICLYTDNIYTDVIALGFSWNNDKQARAVEVGVKNLVLKSARRAVPVN